MVSHRDTRGIPTERKTRLLICLSVGVAVELLSDLAVSTEKLSSVLSVVSVRGSLFFRALRGFIFYPCNSVVNSFLCALCVLRG